MVKCHAYLFQAGVVFTVFLGQRERRSLPVTWADKSAAPAAAAATDQPAASPAPWKIKITLDQKQRSVLFKSFRFLSAHNMHPTLPHNMPPRNMHIVTLDKKSKIVLLKRGDISYW